MFLSLSEIAPPYGEESRKAMGDLKIFQDHESAPRKKTRYERGRSFFGGRSFKRYEETPYPNLPEPAGSG